MNAFMRSGEISERRADRAYTYLKYVYQSAARSHGCDIKRELMQISKRFLGPHIR